MEIVFYPILIPLGLIRLCIKDGFKRPMGEIIGDKDYQELANEGAQLVMESIALFGAISLFGFVIFLLLSSFANWLLEIVL
jgi:hypothetical protein